MVTPTRVTPTRRRSLPRRFPAKGIPRGWYQIGWSSDFEPGNPTPLNYFQCHLVAYRSAGTSGQPGPVRVLDAYCRHMGAHLGFGGQVEGDCIRCPYHGWLYDSDGANIEVPYSDEGRTGARLSSWPTAEVDGLVLVWFDPEAQPPSVDPPRSLARSPHPHYGLEQSVHLWPGLKMTPQVVADNVCDAAHFTYVHRSNELPTLMEYRDNGGWFHSNYEIEFGGGVEETFATPDGPVLGAIRTEAFGLGLMWNRMSGIDDVISSLGVTPIDETTADVRLSVWVPTVRPNGEPLPERIRAAWVKQQRSQTEADLLIWENQTYVDRPPFLKSEADAMKAFRAYSARWYAE
jgi:3-ketosteroid 9alpha-monooxygenase subunit A